MLGEGIAPSIFVLPRTTKGGPHKEPMSINYLEILTVAHLDTMAFDPKRIHALEKFP